MGIDIELWALSPATVPFPFFTSDPWTKVVSLLTCRDWEKTLGCVVVKDPLGKCWNFYYSWILLEIGGGPGKEGSFLVPLSASRETFCGSFLLCTVALEGLFTVSTKAPCGKTGLSRALA